MDPLGNVVREFLKTQHATHVRNAVALAKELRVAEKMADDQIEEMLYASGFDAAVIAEALDNIPSQKKVQ